MSKNKSGTATVMAEAAAWLRRGRASALSFLRDATAMAAIEMAFVFPVMVILYVGLVDVTNLVSINRRVTLTASTLADLVTQVDGSTTMAEIDGIFESARSIFEPHPVDGISLSLFAFRLNGGTPQLRWKHTNGADCGATPSGGEEMEGLMEDGNDIVVARVCYDHAAIIGAFLGTGDFEIDDELMLRPRQANTLLCSDCPTS
jgi:hypothetical protein